MQYSAILALLAASGALAAPSAARRQVDTSVRVFITDNAGTNGEAGIEAGGPGFAGFSSAPSAPGPFSSVELKVGAGLPQQDLRCQLIDESGLPIVMSRGENTDATFSDAGKGPWTFSAFHTVTRVTCDPNLPKAGPDDFKLNVKLTNTAIGNVDENKLPSGGTFSITTGFGALFDIVELEVGSQVQDQETRCQVLDTQGNPLVVLRGENRDITFSDADKGPWTFEVGATEVSKVICDPSFVKGSA